MPETVRAGAGPARGRLAALALGAAALAGCGLRGSGGALRSESLGTESIALGTAFRTAVYSYEQAGDTSFLLSDVPAEALVDGTVQDGQVMHIELLWVPKAGTTPMEATATNASIRHVVIARGEVGIYGGAGFAIPHGRLGARHLEVTLHDATVRLLEATEGFRDPLSPARITGTFTAERDPVRARKVQRAISQLVTTALGRARYVRGAAAMTGRDDRRQ